jgi:hypothetical protein
MKTARNPFTGYTYQEQIIFLFLVMMDAERKFNSIEIEADVEDNFDDVIIHRNTDLICCQIKDIDSIILNDLKFSKNVVSIKGKEHYFSDNGINVLVFKNIDLKTNCKFLGLPALKKMTLILFHYQERKRTTL